MMHAVKYYLLQAQLYKATCEYLLRWTKRDTFFYTYHSLKYDESDGMNVISHPHVPNPPKTGALVDTVAPLILA